MHSFKLESDKSILSFNTGLTADSPLENISKLRTEFLGFNKENSKSAM